MIDKTKIVDTVINERLKKLPMSPYPDLRTYKWNTTVVIAKLAEDDLLVMEAVVRAGQANSLTTLRFNFRGVGFSQGREYFVGKCLHT